MKMKPEQLKDKIVFAYNEDKFFHGTDCFVLEDVKAAVEWFKEWELETCGERVQCDSCNNLFVIWYRHWKKKRILCKNCLVDKSFPDLK